MVASILLGLAVATAASPLSWHIPRATEYDFTTSVNASLPNITIFGTGGTIASPGSTNTQTVGYLVGLGISDLVDAIPEILNVSCIRGFQISHVGSGSINQTILLELASRINDELARDEISGVVVAHGTDTLEETAFFPGSGRELDKACCYRRRHAASDASHRSADGFVHNYDMDFTIGSGFYNPQKARVLLQLALAKDYALQEIKDVFAESYPIS